MSDSGMRAFAGLAVVVVLAAVLGCGSRSVLGVWRVKVQGNFESIYQTFKEDGTFVAKITIPMASNPTIDITGIYKFEADTLSLSPKNVSVTGVDKATEAAIKERALGLQVESKSKIKWVSGEEFVLTEMNPPLTYTFVRKP